MTFNACSEAQCLLTHVLHEFVGIDALGEAGEILHFGGDGQLSSGLNAFINHRVQSGATGINGSGISGGAGTENQTRNHII